MALVVLSVGAPSHASAQTLPDILRNRLEAGRSTGEYQVEAERILAVNALPDFYMSRAFRPAWISPAGAVTPRADSLMAALADAPTHGLDPQDYHGRTLAGLRRAARGGGAGPGNGLTHLEQADLELLLTDAFLVYGSHLLFGRVDPTRVEAEWIANRRDGDMAAVLHQTLESRDIRGGLESLAPDRPEYQGLRAALAHLVGVRDGGGWGSIDAGPTLRPDSVVDRVVQLRARLEASTEARERELAVPDEGVDPRLLDARLAEAVSIFQQRHGLDADGAVGERTLAALNVSVDVRIRQVQANLERWRWLPHEMGDRHIRVNIAAFETQVWEADTVAVRLRSIVGRQYRMTPSFTGSMRYLVLAPYWHVPPTIASQDKLPEIRRDVNYIARQRFSLLDIRNNNPVDPTSVDWASMTGSTFNRTYRLRQDPGPANALGNVKFMFPNPWHVYLHDTPQRELFQRIQRDFSSGCIRVENPLELAQYLLSADPSWTADRIRQVVAGGVETTVHLRAPVPVHLLYMTAFVDDAGHMNFRADIYGRDQTVLEALAGDPPAP